MQKPNRSNSRSRQVWRKKNRLFGKGKKQPELQAESYFVRKNLLNVKVGRFEFLVRLV